MKPKKHEVNKFTATEKAVTAQEHKDLIKEQEESYHKKQAEELVEAVFNGAEPETNVEFMCDSRCGKCHICLQMSISETHQWMKKKYLTKKSK